MTVIEMSCPYCGVWDFLPTDGEGSRNFDNHFLVDGVLARHPMMVHETEWNNQCAKCEKWSVYDDKDQKHHALVNPTNVTSDRVD